MHDETTTPAPADLPAPAAMPAPLATPAAETAAPVAPSAATPTPSPASDEERIGRYTRTELEAMQGRRGRKPPEFYQLFPAGTTPAAAATPAVARPRAAHRTPAPRVSSAILGDHSIDDLLAKAGTKGAKPPAYRILVEAAEHLLAAGAVAAPPIADPLARRVEAAPAKVRRLVEALLDATDTP